MGINAIGNYHYGSNYIGANRTAQAKNGQKTFAGNAACTQTANITLHYTGENGDIGAP